MTDTTFTVPATLTLADVTRRPRGETAAQRMTRLAQKAIIEGCTVLPMRSDRMWETRVGVTSGSTVGLIYVVDLDARTCTCKAGRACKHLFLATVTIGAFEPAAA